MKRRISTILISSGTILLILSMLLSTVSFAAGPARPLDDAQAMPPAQGEGNCLENVCEEPYKYEAPGGEWDGMCGTVPEGEVVTAVSIKTGQPSGGCIYSSNDCYTITFSGRDWCAERTGTPSDTCQGVSHVEVCTQADPCYNVTCDDGDLCTADACNPNTGQCESTPVTCDDGDACTTDACDPATGQCASDPVICQDDGLWCNGTPTCDPLTGECVPGTPPDCDDDNICTDDSCDEANDECDNVFDVTNDPSCEACAEVVCDDGLWCNGLETCDPATGLCVDGTPPDCDDGLLCTDDSCDEDADECVNVFDVNNDPSCEACLGVDCDDGDWCNGLEWCNPDTGTCVPGTPPNCDDGLLCTDDSCDEDADECVNVFDVNNDPSCEACYEVVCDDGLWCNGLETCVPDTGLCVDGTPPDCDDQDICTDDSCDEANDECDNVFDVTNDASCEAPAPTPTPGPCANATIYVDVTQCNAPVAGLSVVLHSSAGDSYGPKMTPATFSVIGGSNRDWYAVIDGTRMGGTIKVTECGGTGAIGAALDCPAPPVVEVLGVERLPVTGEMPLGPAFSTLPMILSSLSLIGSALLLRRKE